MQHKGNTEAAKSKSHLSTRDKLAASQFIEENTLNFLKHKLPTDWVGRVQLKVSYSASRIREVLRDSNKYNQEIMDAIIKVAEEYKEEVEAGVLAQKAKILNLKNS